MMAGALAVFRRHGVDLVGGHSAEGADLGISFTVSGALDGNALDKGGLRQGDSLVLTKPLGTGAVLAGAMRGRARAADVVAAIEHMDQSNADAVQVLRDHDVHGCTDVSGFGLAGHLSEMTRASRLGAVLTATVPLLPGASALVADGVTSSLQRNNEQALDDYVIRKIRPDAPAVRLLADPQTSGGLLAGIPAAAASSCMARTSASRLRGSRGGRGSRRRGLGRPTLRPRRGPLEETRHRRPESVHVHEERIVALDRSQRLELDVRHALPQPFRQLPLLMQRKQKVGLHADDQRRAAP